MKTKSFIMKNEIFFGAEILKGYCSVCIVREKKKKIYIARHKGNCIAGWLEKGQDVTIQFLYRDCGSWVILGKLYCDTKIVLQLNDKVAEQLGARGAGVRHGRAAGAGGTGVGRWAQQARAGGAGRAQAGTAGSRARGALAGVRGRVGGRCRSAGAGCSGRRSARQAGRAGAARRRRAAGARAGMAWAQRGARLGARCARGTTGLGAGWVRRLGQLGQFWCTVHLAQFWLGFWTRFDSVFS